MFLYRVPTTKPYNTKDLRWSNKAKQLNYSLTKGMMPFTGPYKRKENKFESEQFSFDLSICEAWSYGWWLFVKRVGDTIYFNDYNYSVQTENHQEMAMNILELEDYKKHGLKLVKVYVRAGLHNIGGEIANIEFQVQELLELIGNPKAQAKTKLHRIKQVQELKTEIEELKKLRKILDV